MIFHVVGVPGLGEYSRNKFIFQLGEVWFSFAFMKFVKCSLAALADSLGILKCFWGWFLCVCFLPFDCSEA